MKIWDSVYLSFSIWVDDQLFKLFRVLLALLCLMFIKMFRSYLNLTCASMYVITLWANGRWGCFGDFHFHKIQNLELSLQVWFSGLPASRISWRLWWRWSRRTWWWSSTSIRARRNRPSVRKQFCSGLITSRLDRVIWGGGGRRGWEGQLTPPGVNFIKPKFVLHNAKIFST